MTLVLDIGNTNIVMGLYNGKKWVQQWRIHTDTQLTSDEIALKIKGLFLSFGYEEKAVERVAICSVVPALTFVCRRACKRLFSLNPFIVTIGCETGLVKSSIPPELGSDLLCDLSRAHEVFPDDYVCVLDFGTALTCSSVSPKGEVLGVAIAPGLLTSVNALAGGTAQLPVIELSVPETVLGKNTVDSIRGGIMFGFAGLAENLVRQTEKEIGQKVKVIATGGLADQISKMVPGIDLIDKLHTLNGICTVLNLN